MKNYKLLTDTISSLVPMDELVASFGFQKNRGGYINCPFHSEKTGSLKVWDDHWKCFGCGAYGDQISFVRLLLNLNFTEAVEYLNREFRLNLPGIDKPFTAREISQLERARRQHQEKNQIREQLTSRKHECFLFVLDIYNDLKKQMKENKPASPGDEPNELFTDALRRLGFIEFMLDELGGG